MTHNIQVTRVEGQCNTYLPGIWINWQDDIWELVFVFIGNLLRWGFLIWELIFIYCGLFVLILVVFCCFFSLRFGQISPLAFFRWLTATSDRNAESCNCLPSNYCLPRFWSSKPLAGLGRDWNRYLLTMLTSISCATGPEGRSRLDFLVLLIQLFVLLIWFSIVGSVPNL